MTTDPMHYLDARAQYERIIRDAVGAGSEVWMTDRYILAVANVGGSTQVVAQVSVTVGDSDSVMRSLHALAVLVGAG